MKSLFEIQAHKNELLQQGLKAQEEGNFIKRDIIAKEIFKAEKAIATWGTKQNATYRIM